MCIIDYKIFATVQAIFQFVKSNLLHITYIDFLLKKLTVSWKWKRRFAYAKHIRFSPQFPCFLLTWYIGLESFSFLLKMIEFYSYRSHVSQPANRFGSNLCFCIFVWHGSTTNLTVKLVRDLWFCKSFMWIDEKILFEYHLLHVFLFCFYLFFHLFPPIFDALLTFRSCFLWTKINGFMS